ncbi:single-stranded-DNA-specific exonuclease RecJ [Alkalibacillus haloalkaliphilus]|uniref:single-stranded-DNA-specific exonuclease RecJ n=1 Tax=Alkalibacillus haloalkaliphilus TaxID=94136 RepID=UPI002935C779|nr:single-stranded-DNA-specific exonuclease RecJ [Alkalibacillus haloalkaliphilus]MDV2581093.1 single-stranded-DNA-specific exonuclease RecJ [Alkalibacillus haloalkaliphilus]
MLKSKMNWKSVSNNQTPQLNLSVSSVIERMLVRRGIHTQEEAEAFLYPTINDLHDPFLFEQMERVVLRIKQAIENEEKILIYGDYDADGVTATSVLVKTLSSLGAIVDYYIPNRFTEGYGPNEAAFRAVHEAGGTLIITVDNGIAAPKEAAVAKELGIDLIITDHHEEQDEIPDAYAIIHPRLSENYPFNDLAGVGVAFKLAHALLGQIPKELTGLVAIGTVADLVPLKGENRVLVKQGLSTLTHNDMPGIEAIKTIGKIEPPITTEHIGFIIGPRINAVGRLQDASLAVDLILEDDPIIAEDMAKEIDELNLERQQIVKEIADQAFEMIEQNHKDDDVIILANEGWNPGVLGIVASRIVNKYYKPTIVLGIDRDKGIAKGSGRSIPAYDMFKEGMKVNDLFVHFGGHAQAAGMTVNLDQLDDLRKVLNEKASEILTEEDLIPNLMIEDEVNWAELDINFPQELELLAPFGMENEKPVFQVNQVKLTNIRKIGAKQNHIKLHGDIEGLTVEMIGFQMGDIADKLTLGSEVDVVGEIEVNEWNGNRKLQVKLKDLRCNQWQLFDYRGKGLTDQVKSILSSDQVLFVYFNESPTFEKEANYYHYSELTLLERQQYNKLVCLDLPESLETFEEAIQFKQFEAIYLCFNNENNHLFSFIPSRDAFKTLYVTLKKHQVIKHEQKAQLAEAKNWSLEQLDFMLEVFFDLNFVKITNGDITFRNDVEFKPLEESVAYKRKQDALKVEETLYYSNYGELKEWIDSKLRLQTKEGEVVHGL